MSSDDPPTVAPKFEREVTEENEILVSVLGLGSAELEDGTEIDISWTGGDYVKFVFDDGGDEREDDDRVVFTLGEMAYAAAVLAGYEVDEEEP